MDKFKFKGYASVLHLNARKEGPGDEKELAVDVKMEAVADGEVAGFFEPALADFLFLEGGSALSQGADVLGAMREVARANLDKLVKCECVHPDDAEDFSLLYVRHDPECNTCSGTGRFAVKDANGKVKKPEGWRAPYIEPFVCNADRA